ncbi:MAG: hypothetical protein IJX42_00870 [Oscillospiraceae bacterium]|nr:hypothetical protein [Oscillospiraceae bacterium]
MARFDLNRDGKKDIFDSMIEYEIYKDVMGEDDEITPSSFSRKKYLEINRSSSVSDNDDYKSNENPIQNGYDLFCTIIGFLALLIGGGYLLYYLFT